MTAISFFPPFGAINYYFLLTVLATFTQSRWNKLEIHNYNLFRYGPYTTPMQKLPSKRTCRLQPRLTRKTAARPHESWAWAHFRFSMRHQYHSLKQEGLRRMGYVICGISVGSNPRFTDLMRYGMRSVIKRLTRICERKE